MKAAEIMTANVITIAPGATIAEAAELLLTHRISGAPVVDAEGKLVGIVSEGDLLRRVEAGTERRRSWWLEIFTRADTLAGEYVKAHGRKVSDIMTRWVVTIVEDTSLADVADLLEGHRIKRVPVLRDDKVVGIVSRANVLRAIAGRPPIAPIAKADDRTIRDEVMERIERAPWGRPWNLNIMVKDGVVELWGAVTTIEEKDAVRIAAETTSGVVAVKDNLMLQRVLSGV
jgi:CBS-domain-containing membrane protein